MSPQQTPQPAPTVTSNQETNATDIAVETLPTPDGMFTIITEASGVLAAGWTQDLDELCQKIHPSIRPHLEAVHRARDSALGNTAPGHQNAATAVASQARLAVTAYYDGDRTSPTSVPVHMVSGPFRERAWEVLRGITPGQPISYTKLAERIGSVGAVRAAGAACATNAAALFVPCHRVLRSDGGLGGFLYGRELKQRLLERESQGCVNMLD